MLTHRERGRRERERERERGKGRRMGVESVKNGVKGSEAASRQREHRIKCRKDEREREKKC